MSLNPAVRDNLAENLFSPGAVPTGAKLAQLIADIPMGGDASSSDFWEARVRLIRDLLFFGEQSQRALDIIDELHTEDFVDAVRKKFGVSFRLVLKRVQRPQYFFTDVQMKAVKEGFLKPYAKGSGKAITEHGLEEFFNRILVPTSNRMELREYVDVEDSQEIETGPTNNAEKRVWAAFKEASSANTDIRSIADVIASGFREQSEGAIDGKSIDNDMLKGATKSIGANFRTGSPEAETRTVLIRRLQAVDNPADLVTRHTFGLLNDESSLDPTRLRKELQIAEGAYCSSSDSTIENRVLQNVNRTDALEKSPLEKGSWGQQAQENEKDLITRRLMVLLIPLTAVSVIWSLINDLKYYPNSYALVHNAGSALTLGLFLVILHKLVRARTAKRWIGVFGFVYVFFAAVIGEIFFTYFDWEMSLIVIMVGITLVYLFAKGKEYKNGVL